ncbi:hypothetical protein BRADI_3g32257v3 [Brachypodium distachyon]|uniref:Uncharacterized protein n=1 Tax=Brachypodium distachyon TaxID=15368 RepID=A0A2K2D0J4_BRADI|nr:hypothetical protein BRADI_3g32257v3 [Brachypodium distachyon]
MQYCSYVSLSQPSRSASAAAAGSPNPPPRRSLPRTAPSSSSSKRRRARVHALALLPHTSAAARDHHRAGLSDRHRHRTGYCSRCGRPCTSSSSKERSCTGVVSSPCHFATSPSLLVRAVALLCSILTMCLLKCWSYFW